MLACSRSRGAAKLLQCRPWVAIVVFLAARGALQAARYPALVRATF
jgi:hypothetical protein